MATMKDVAVKAGVSITTVSHVINNTRFVSEEVRDNVESAIRDLGYYPSAVARSLKNDQTYTIGMIVPNNTNPYFAEIIREIENNCFDLGYSIILCNTNDNPERQVTYTKLLIEKRVDGLIINSSGTDEELINLLAERPLPKVIVDREVEGLNADLVETDNLYGGQVAVNHLISLGHRKIGCITGPTSLSSSKERLEGFRLALETLGFEINPEWIIEGNFKSPSGYEGMKKLLALDNRPTGVFVFNDLMAIGALRATYEEELSIPRDLSIVGFDDIRLASYASPPLTTIAQPKAKMGKAITNLLIRQIKNEDTEPQRVLIKPELVVRMSTRPPNSKQ